MKMPGVTYAKCLYAGPEFPADPPYSEVIYNLPQAPPRRKSCATIGICDNWIGVGATGVVFEVQLDSGQGWQTKYVSPMLTGPSDPIAISVDWAGAQRLQLDCKDADNQISADYAVWADARLE